MILRPLTPAVTACCIVAAAQPADAAGFFIAEQSVRGLGRAHAGNAVAADDASTVFYNPAALTELERRPTVQAGAHLIIPSAEFNNEDSATVTPGSVVALPQVDDEGPDPFDPTLVPNLYLVAPVHEKLWLGLGVAAPFGLRVDYGAEWFGRYDSTETSLTTINVTPAAAYQVNDWLSLGAGIDIQYAKARLENAVPNPLVPGGPTPATDGRALVKGDDVSVGFNVGALLKPTDAARIGLHFRSGISHDLEGRARLTGLAGGIPGVVDLAAANFSTGGAAELDLPAIATLAAAYQLTRKLTVLGHLQWFNWSSFDEIRVEFDDGRPDSVVPQEYDDTLALALGAEYQWNDALSMRAGMQYDPTPTVDRERSTRVPDGDRFWLALGASFRPNSWLSFDFGYTHIFIDDPKVDVTRSFFDGTPLASSARISATGDYTIDIVSAQLNIRF